MSLAVFPQNWERALCVVAHPDDMEYGASSAVAAWVNAGRDVRYILATSGEAGIATIEPRHCGPMRELEQKAACAAVGVTELEFFGFPDGLLEPTIDLRRALAGAIRRHRPDVVVSINHHQTWGHGAWNHVDHRVLGESLLDAVRDAANPWIFTDQGEAWEGVQFTAFHGSPKPTHAVVVDQAAVDAGVASLRSHDAYLSALTGDMADPQTFIEDLARADGELAGVSLAVNFEIVQ